MIDDKLTSNVGVGTSPAVSMLDQLNQIGSKQHIDAYGVASSPNLNSNSSRFLTGLPDIRADKIPFGIGAKGDFTASLNNSRQFFENNAAKKRIHNQSMTIDIPEASSRNEIYMPMIKTASNR